MSTSSYSEKFAIFNLIFILLLFSSNAHSLQNNESLGTYYSSEVTYLDLAEYVSLNKLGPYFIEPKRNPTNFVFSKFSKAKKICFNRKDLREFVPKNLSIEKAFEYLPITEDSGVVPGSITFPDANRICYQLRKGSEKLTDEDFKEEMNKSKRLFSNFHGLDSIPKENRDELMKIWNSSSSISTRNKKLSKYWQKKINYIPDALDILWKYVKVNPNKNILQAMFHYNFGDCGPKNFALGISIWELSRGTIPVRLNYSIWLRPADKDYTPLTADRIHIHVEYLVKNRKLGYEWKTAESSYSTSAYNNIYSEFTYK